MGMATGGTSAPPKPPNWEREYEGTWERERGRPLSPEECMDRARKIEKYRRAMEEMRHLMPPTPPSTPWDELKRLAQEIKPMPLFNVAFTVNVFKSLPDGSQQKIEKLVGNTDRIVASSKEAAIAIAARKIPAEMADDEILGAATVLVS